MINKMKELLIKLREEKPLVHEITNYVTVNDCANVTLAIGASPIMAQAKEEVWEIAGISSAVVLNIGTLEVAQIDSMILAGKRANELNIPVILDPVGVGASTLRTESTLRLLREVKFSVIKGNLSEIKVIAGLDFMGKGVDSEEISETKEYIEECSNLIEKVSKDTGAVIVITGKIDAIGKEDEIFFLENGHAIMASVTGMGCVTAAMLGSFCSVTKDYLLASVTAVATMGICGELAYKSLKDGEGSGSFRVKLIDNIFNFNGEKLEKNLKLNK